MRDWKDNYADEKNAPIVDDEPRHIGKRKKKEYPHHFAIRKYGNDIYSVASTHHKIDLGWDWQGTKDVDLVLRQYAAKWPETSTWPVRFINCAPFEIEGREVIK